MSLAVSNLDDWSSLVEAKNRWHDTIVYWGVWCLQIFTWTWRVCHFSRNLLSESATCTGKSNQQVCRSWNLPLYPTGFPRQPLSQIVSVANCQCWGSWPSTSRVKQYRYTSHARCKILWDWQQLTWFIWCTNGSFFTAISLLLQTVCRHGAWEVWRQEQHYELYCQAWSWYLCWPSWPCVGVTGERRSIYLDCASWVQKSDWCVLDELCACRSWMPCLQKSGICRIWRPWSCYRPNRVNFLQPLSRPELMQFCSLVIGSPFMRLGIGLMLVEAVLGGKDVWVCLVERLQEGDCTWIVIDQSNDRQYSWMQCTIALQYRHQIQRDDRQEFRSWILTRALPSCRHSETHTHPECSGSSGHPLHRWHAHIQCEFLRYVL